MSSSPAPLGPASGATAPLLSSRGRKGLLGLCLLGLCLRIWLQKGRAFEGDELGSLRFIEESYAHLVSTFRDQLTMNYFLVLLKALSQTLGDSPWVLTAPSILAGVATIWLTAKLALRFGGERLALGSAFLLAVNPCLIEFSLRIRSYMLLVAMALGAIVAFYDWAEERCWKHGIRCALWSLAALLMHPNALYQMTFIVVMLATELWKRRERALTFLVPMGSAALVTALAYLPIRADMAIFRERWTTSLPSEWNYIPDSLRLFFVGQAWMLPSLALFGTGLWGATQRNRALAKFGLAILVPMLMTSFMGVSHYPWTYARFLMPVLPVMLIFIASGAFYLARDSRWAAALLLLGLAFSWWPRLEKAFQEQRESPYAELAAHIESLHLSDGTLYAFDPVVRGRLVPMLGAQKFTTLGKFLREPDQDDHARLYVLTDRQSLTSDVPRKNFGRMRIYQFDRKTHALVLGLLFKDTAASFADAPIAPPRLAVYYKELILMTQLLKSPRELEFTHLFYRTERYDKKHRQMPEQLRSPARLNR